MGNAGIRERELGIQEANEVRQRIERADDDANAWHVGKDGKILMTLS